jgi:hypothetical protein
MDFLNASKEWVQKCKDFICYSTSKGHEKYLFDDMDIESMSAEEFLEKVSDDMLQEAITKLTKLTSHKEQQAPIPVVFDPEIVKILNNFTEKLSWMKKLAIKYKANKSKTEKEGPQKYLPVNNPNSLKKIEALDKEAKKLFKKCEEKAFNAVLKSHMRELPSLSPVAFLDKIYQSFLKTYVEATTKTQKWMERLDQMREAGNQKNSDGESEDDLWTMPELEELIKLGKDLTIIPHEYNTIKCIH